MRTPHQASVSLCIKGASTPGPGQKREGHMEAQGPQRSGPHVCFPPALGWGGGGGERGAVSTWTGWREDRVGSSGPPAIRITKLHLE